MYPFVGGFFSIMQFALKPGGGVAMQLVPATDQEIEEYKSIEDKYYKNNHFR